MLFKYWFSFTPYGVLRNNILYTEVTYVLATYCGICFNSMLNHTGIMHVCSIHERMLPPRMVGKLKSLFETSSMTANQKVYVFNTSLGAKKTWSMKGKYIYNGQGIKDNLVNNLRPVLRLDSVTWAGDTRKPFKNL